MPPLLDPAAGYLFFALLGLTLGSFGNVVIGRLPAGESLNGRSHCPHCGRTLGALELIPVLSWIFLRAKCYGCGRRISPQYPLIEITVACLFALALYVANFDPLPALITGIAFWTMLMIGMIDAKTQMIPDALTILLALCGIALGLTDGHIPLLAPAIGIGFFGLQWLLSRGKWVGSGDVFLAGALGLLLGSWQMVVLMLFLAYIGGSIVVLIMLLTGKIARGAHLAFGPFLVAGAFVTFAFGDRILNMMFL